MTGSLFSSLTDPQTIIAILVTLAVFATLYTLIMPLFERKDFAKRMKAVSSERDLIRSRERERLAAATRDGKASLRGNNNKSARRIVEKFNLQEALADKNTMNKLRAAGFRLFALTDNLLEVQTRQLEHGGIVDLFERRFSADGVRHHKPSPEAYAYVERELAVAPSRLCLIACHTWDTLGAVAAGWEAALIKRAGNDVLDVGPQPQIVGNDLNDVADQLIARHRAQA